MDELAEKHALVCVKRDAFKAGLLRAAEIVRESPPEFKCACMNIARIADQIESEAEKIEGE